MSKRSVVSAVTLAALVSTLLAVSAASAETRIAVAPAILDLSGPIGDTGSVQVRASNDGDRPLALSASIVELDAAEGLPTATSWTKVAPAKQVLKPSESGSFKVKLDIPNDIAPGGHYAAVSIDASTATDDPDQASGMAGRIIVPLLITVIGDEERPTPWAELAFDRTAVFLRTDGSSVARAEVSNNGGTHRALDGVVAIDAILDEDERERILTTDAPIGRVLPDRVRRFTASDEVSLTPDTAYELTFDLYKPARGRTALDLPELSGTASFDSTPQADLRDLALCEAPNGELEPSIALVNEGSIGVSPDVSFQTVDADGELVALSRSIPELLAWPMETTTAASRMFAPAADGDYQLIAEIGIGTDLTLGAEMDFRIGDDGDVPSCAPAAD